MNIAFLAAADSVHTAKWVNSLATRGFRISLFTQHEVTQTLSTAVTLYRLPYQGQSGYFLNAKYLRQLLKKLNPEVLHAHYATGYGTLDRLCKYKPLVLSVWGSDVCMFPNFSFVHRKWLKMNLNSADILCSTSQHMADVMRTDLNLNKPITITPFGIDTQLFQPKSSLKLDQCVIGTVRRLDKIYGIDRILKTFAQAQSQTATRLKLHIIGDGPEKQALVQLAHELNVADDTEFLGAVPHEHVVAEYQRFDIYMSLSRNDSFGVSILEASACGLPIIATDVGGNSEVVKHNSTGYLVDEVDLTMATQQLIKLINHNDTRKQLGSQGRSFVQQYYDWNQSLEIMEHVYEQVLRQG